MGRHTRLSNSINWACVENRRAQEHWETCGTLFDTGYTGRHRATQDFLIGEINIGGKTLEEVCKELI